jgi:hypothetical protein
VRVRARRQAKMRCALRSRNGWAGGRVRKCGSVRRVKRAARGACRSLRRTR